jgi:hypothetical protein
MGSFGLYDGALGRGQVENVVVINNGAGGISGNIVTGCTAEANGGEGMEGVVVTRSSAKYNKGRGIAGNVVVNCESFGNGGVGIRGFGVVTGNHTTDNTGFGLDMAASSGGYSNNVINFNAGGTVTSGVQMGTNVCNGSTTCP